MDHTSKCKAIQLWEGNVGETPCDLGLGRELTGARAKSQFKKEKKKKTDQIGLDQNLKLLREWKHSHRTEESISKPHI